MAQCISLVNIRNPHYPLRGTSYMGVPCGKCPNCLQDRRADWSLRLQIELKHSTSAHFITLTYNDESMYYNEDGQPSVELREMQLYMKKLRKTTKKKLRYYLVGEYGTKTKRPHYHILLFNYPKCKEHHIIDCWSHNNTPKGHVKIGNITAPSIHYVTKYHVNKTSFPEHANKCFVSMSRRPGIGAKYIDEYKDYHKGNLSRAYVTQLGGEKRRLPRYLKDKLYTKIERLKMNVNNDIRIQQKEEEDMQHHSVANPGKNYYQYCEEKKLQAIRQFKEKINKNDTF